MYAYVYAYKLPNDDEQALAARVHIDYPIRADRLLGWGELPSVRSQRRLHPDGWFRGYEKVLVWAHWVWFATPHASLAYLYFRDRPRFARAAVLMYAVFDTGVVTYWLAPTAPPWYASTQGRFCGERGVRRLMVEYGEQFWGRWWAPLYSVFGGNPLAAMPSLHFATSTMAASLLSESDTVAGAVGWGYAGVLGFALVHLGEHYAVDLLGGLALTLAVRRAERVARGPVIAAGRLLERLARYANELPAPE
jgi:membrane-associated phospholipid phosphatase